MLITIRVINVRVFYGSEEQGPHCRALGYMPSGQLLIEGRIFAGHAPSVHETAANDVRDWLRDHRPGWTTSLDNATNHPDADRRV